jgi:hypothetical protein
MRWGAPSWMQMGGEKNGPDPAYFSQEAVRRGFLRVLVSLLRSYRAFLLAPEGADQAGATARATGDDPFDVAGYLDAASREQRVRALSLSCCAMVCARDVSHSAVACGLCSRSCACCWRRRRLPTLRTSETSASRPTMRFSFLTSVSSPSLTGTLSASPRSPRRSSRCAPPLPVSPGRHCLPPPHAQRERRGRGRHTHAYVDTKQREAWMRACLDTLLHTLTQLMLNHHPHRVGGFAVQDAVTYRVSRTHAAAPPNADGWGERQPGPLPRLPRALDPAKLMPPRPCAPLIRATDLIQLKSHTHALARHARLEAQARGLVPRTCMGEARMALPRRRAGPPQ